MPTGLAGTRSGLNPSATPQMATGEARLPIPNDTFSLPLPPSPPPGGSRPAALRCLDSMFLLTPICCLDTVRRWLVGWLGGLLQTSCSGRSLRTPNQPTSSGACLPASASAGAAGSMRPLTVMVRCVFFLRRSISISSCSTRCPFAHRCASRFGELLAVGVLGGVGCPPRRAPVGYCLPMP